MFIANTYLVQNYYAVWIAIIIENYNMQVLRMVPRVGISRPFNTVDN